jgi:hypothetical protein
MSPLRFFPPRISKHEHERMMLEVSKSQQNYRLKENAQGILKTMVVV